MKRTAIITGAANGIGAATARRFVADGYRDVLVDIAPSGQHVAEELGSDAVFLCADLAHASTGQMAVDMALDRFGGLDTVVNNGGISLIRKIGDVTIDEWDHVQAVNLRASWIMLKAAQPSMRARRSPISPRTRRPRQDWRDSRAAPRSSGPHKASV
jgi:NAD(P)-dependent dehydrogenase (short-subunit alcohol dehydrogenase family)